MLNEDQALELAKTPDKIISPQDCTTIIGYLNGEITDLEVREWEEELVAGQHKVALMNEQGNTNAKAEALWKISDPYQAWKQTERSIRKFKQLRDNLKRRHDDLAGTRAFVRH